MECLPWRTCTTLTFFCAALPRSSQPQCPDIDPANIHGPKVENPSSNACLSNSSFPPLHILRSRSFPFFHLKRKGIPKAVGGGRHSQRICCLQSPEHPPPPSPVILWFLVNSQFCEEGHWRQLRYQDKSPLPSGHRMLRPRTSVHLLHANNTEFSCLLILILRTTQ